MSEVFKFWLVVVLSFFTSALFLAAERAVGLGWDFHPDSLTYATTSDVAFFSIVDNWSEIFNNGYYVLAYLLGQSVIAITLMNMLVFAFTNGLIFKAVKRKSHFHITAALLLLLFLNPYRLHLSTTMLKDTLIIFFMVLLVSSTNTIRVVSLVSMVLLRIASPVYFIILIPRRFIFYITLAFALLATFYWDPVVGRILEFNEQDMQLRGFDTIPTFKEFGLSGSIVRGIVWSFLSLSGTFALVSPSLEFAPVAIGSIMTLVFVKKVTGSFKVPLQILVVTSIFGVMVTGFTAYIRYIYPVLVVWPLIVIAKND